MAERIEASCSDQHSLKILHSASEAYTDIEEVLEMLEVDELELYASREANIAIGKLTHDS